MSDIVISVENLYKQYRLGTVGTGTLRDDVSRFLAKVRGKEDPTQKIGAINSLSEVEGEYVWALQDINFEVKRGEVLGIIGKNGAGKSTLLKLLSKVTSPTKGQIKVKGRIASLLEVGTGFHPELTGKENIFLNGAILGMTKAEIKSKLDEIVAFSGVAKYLDTPVKRYSSGMYVRLAFAVAAHLEPEILIVDEVLAVGDAEFQKKCLGKMQDVAGQGRTVLFVSHQMDMIKGLCQNGLLLVQGKVNKAGRIDRVVDEYLNKISTKEFVTQFERETQKEIDVQIIKGEVLSKDKMQKGLFDVFENIIIRFEYIVQKEVRGSLINFELILNGQTPIFLSFDTDENLELLEHRNEGFYVCEIEIPAPLLKPGNYSINTNTGIANKIVWQRLEGVLSFEVDILSKPSSLMSYATKRPGLIASSLNWNIKKMEEKILN